MLHELGINQIVSSTFYSQSQEAIERCHHTMKTMIKTYCTQVPRDWDVAVAFLLFALWDSLNDSTEFTLLRYVTDVQKHL